MNVPRVIVVGGGFAGCGAAISAKKAGADVIVLERTDELGGLGLVGGSFKMSGQFTAHEEAIAMGAGEVPLALDAERMYENRELPGQHHVSLYNLRSIGKRLHETLTKLGVEVKYRSRVIDVNKTETERVFSIKLQGEQELEADAFVDCTGTFGPEVNCKKYGKGCVMCIMRCPTYGGRVSLTARAGVEDKKGVKRDGTVGTYSAAFTLIKETLSVDLQKRLEQEGSVLLEVPKEISKECAEKIKLLAPSVTPDHAEILTLTYMGFVNIVGLPYLTQEELRKIPGFENAIVISPYTGWMGNSIRYMSVTPRDKFLKVNGIDNVFVAGEKMGGQPNGVTEAYVTGILAGHNAVRSALGQELFELPRSTAIGEFVAFTDEHQSDLDVRYSLIWGTFFERMKELGLYSTDVQEIKKRVENAGLTNVFAEKIV